MAHSVKSVKSVDKKKKGIMKVVLIGRGRLAANLFPALQQAGHEVVSINSRTLDGLPAVADVFIVSVKDAALVEVVGKTAKGREEQLFVHTAGSMPMSLFSSLVKHYGVFYPMQTFSKERLVSFREIPLFLEASDDATLRVLHQLAESLTTHVYELDGEGRKALHLAAVFACNFVNHCYALSARVLERQGLPFSVMLPLIDETARKVHELSPRDAQTGPAVRHDENVIGMQACMLGSDPVMRDIYELLSRSIQNN